MSFTFCFDISEVKHRMNKASKRFPITGLLKPKQPKLTATKEKEILSSSFCCCSRCGVDSSCQISHPSLSRLPNTNLEPAVYLFAAIWSLIMTLPLTTRLRLPPFYIYRPHVGAAPLTDQLQFLFLFFLLWRLPYWKLRPFLASAEHNIPNPMHEPIRFEMSYEKHSQHQAILSSFHNSNGRGFRLTVFTPVPFNTLVCWHVQARS